MKKIPIIPIINGILGIYIAVWVYYMIFNWELFSIKLNTNAGFSVIPGYPFAFFFLLGFAGLLIMKYFIHIFSLNVEQQNKDREHRIKLQEKDIELLKMKEILFKMQTSELDKSNAQLNALHKKLDSFSAAMNNGSGDKEEITGDPEEKSEKEKE